MAPISSHRSSVSVGASLGLLVVGLAACSRKQTVQGECRPVNGADVCAWGEMSGSQLVAFGVTVPVSSADNAPAEEIGRASCRERV